MTVLAQKPSRSPCKIAFLGEAPGAGAEGKIFDAILRTAGIDKSEHWVGNVFTDPLPEDEVGKWCANTKTARTEGFADIPPIGACGYLKPEHRHYLTDLQAQFKKYKPTVVVPMGGTALWAMTGSANIGQNRGAVQASSVIPGYKVLPTYDPGYIMRQWKFYSIAVGDILKAVNEAERGPEVFYPKRELLLAPSIQQVEDFAVKTFIDQPPLLSVDIETGWGMLTCIGFAPSTESAICIPFVDLRKPNKSYWGSVEKEIRAWRVVTTLLTSGIPKLGQNFAAYDAYWLLAKYGIKTMNLLHDTRLLHHAIYPELPKDLAFLGASYTQQGNWKTWAHSAKTKRDD